MAWMQSSRSKYAAVGVVSAVLRVPDRAGSDARPVAHLPKAQVAVMTGPFQARGQAQVPRRLDRLEGQVRAIAQEAGR